MKVVGLAGQIASGKSTVAEVFSDLGAAVVSGDELGKEVVEKDRDILNELVSVFGDRILTPRGRLRRRELGRLVFADPERLAQLNRIVHPPLLRKLRSIIARYRLKPWAPMLLVDAALILDWELDDEFDAIVVVESRVADQVARLVAGGATTGEARYRIARQLPKQEQRRRADLVIRNYGSLEKLRKRAVLAYKKLSKPVDKR
jgi:dephospho-CoA kinase